MALREDLVARGVRFSRNPKVRRTPEEEKRRFLAQKGLTDAEIREVLRRSRVLEQEEAAEAAWKRAAVATEGATRPGGAYSQAITAGPLVFVSGTVGLKAEGGLADGPGEQASRALEIIDAVLKAAKSHMKQVLKTTVMLADMADYRAVDAAYRATFARLAGDDTLAMPARCCYQVAALPRGARVEIDAIALGGRPAAEEAESVGAAKSKL